MSVQNKKLLDEKFMNANLDPLEDFLGPSDGWRRAAFSIIGGIPRGHLATYGRIAELVMAHGHSAGPRNIAWLRHELYGLLGHETTVPLHRVAKAGDIDSLADSGETKKLNDRLRREEGFFENQRWI